MFFDFLNAELTRAEMSRFLGGGGTGSTGGSGGLNPIAQVDAVQNLISQPDTIGID